MGGSEEKLPVPNESAINAGRTELTTSIDAGDFLNLYNSIPKLQLLFPQLEQTYKTLLVEALKTLKLDETKKRNPIASLLGCQPYNFISWPSVEEKFRELFKGIINQQNLHQQIETLYYSAYSVSKSLQELYSPIKTFLNYFFATPINHSAWERKLEAIIPVTEKGLFSQWVRPFKKTEHEEGRSQSENMQMIPSTLKNEHIDFYVTKIIEAAQRCDDNTKNLVQLVSSIKTGTGSIDSKVQEKYDTLNPEVLEYFKKDVILFNYFLQELTKKPYSPQTGINAIGLNVARMRVKEVVNKIAEELKNEAYILSQLGEPSVWEGGQFLPLHRPVYTYIPSLSNLLEEAGFSISLYTPFFGKTRKEVVKKIGTNSSYFQFIQI